MNKKVLVISFSFEQEPDAFEVLREGGLEPILWAQKDREGTTQSDFINYWNSLSEKPSGILIGADFLMDEEFMNAAKNDLKAVSLNCAGYDHVDLNAAKKAGIAVVNVPRQNFDAVADFAWGLILSLMRKIPQGDKNIRAGKWVDGVARGIAVSKKTLGILGVGAIGRGVAQRAMGFEMEILGSDPFPNDEIARKYHLNYVEREELFKRSDILVICAPANESTYHAVNAETLKLMKPTAVVVNPARGAIVDTDALAKAIENGTIAGAAIDAYEEEPLTESPLFALENTVLTPHMGGLADREIRAVAMQAARNMVELINNPGNDLELV